MVCTSYEMDLACLPEAFNDHRLAPLATTVSSIPTKRDRDCKKMLDFAENHVSYSQS